jgi:hypothetical protein
MQFPVRSITGIMRSNPTQGMEILFYMCFIDCRQQPCVESNRLNTRFRILQLIPNGSKLDRLIREGGEGQKKCLWMDVVVAQFSMDLQF